MQNAKVNMITAVTLCLAVAAGAWAVSGEIHNYQVTKIADRQEILESYIMETRDDISDMKGDIKMLLDRAP